MYTNVITVLSELHLVILSHGDEIADPAAGNLWVTCIQISQCQCLAQMSMSVVNCAEITNNKKTSQFPVTEVQRQLLLPTFEFAWNFLRLRTEGFKLFRQNLTWFSSRLRKFHHISCSACGQFFRTQCRCCSSTRIFQILYNTVTTWHMDSML